MAKDSNFNLFRLLIEDDSVDNYTKLIILISQLNHFERYYIPNKLIMNRLHITKAYSIHLVNKLKQKGIIKVQYIGQKRHIKMCSYDYVANPEPFNDDWFDDFD